MENSIYLSNNAYRQFKLMLENDFTLEDKIIRLTISGKECDGFVYQVGFDYAHKDDLIIEASNLNFHLDPFSSHYMKTVKIDYFLDLESGEDGFTIENLDQNKFQGKFFKDEELTPKHLKSNDQQ